MRRVVWSVNSYKDTEFPSINVGDHNESWLDENMSCVKSDKARYLGSNLTSIQRRSVQDAKLWLRGAVTNLWKMSSAAVLCWLPSAEAGVLGHRWPLIILKVPQTDSTGTHTHIPASRSRFSCTGATLPLGVWSRRRPRMRALASETSSSAFPSGKTLHQQKTESRLRNQILLRLQEQPGWWRRRRWGNRGSGRQRLNNLPRSTFSCLARLACCLACPAPLSRCI